MTRAVIIASGASLTKADVELVRYMTDRRVYVVNDSYTWVPWADALYACDEEWWDVHEPKSRCVAERWTTCDAAALKYNLRHIPGQFDGTFDTSGHGIVYGGNSGFQTLNLAFAQGVRDVVLLGFDMGGLHFFGEHPPAIAKPSPFNTWIKHFREAAPVIAAAGMRVVNATRGGRLEAFPRVRLEDVT